jgi:hypothetical protein
MYLSSNFNQTIKGKFQNQFKINMMRKIYLACMALVTTWTLNAQTFTNSTNLLPGSYNSGGCTGVMDMNNDGLDDIIILDNSTDLKIAYQNANGTFSVSSFGTVSGEAQWGMCVGDVDNDGHKDVMSGGHYDNVHIVNINGVGDYEQIEYSWASVFAQAMNFADINNDGWLDGFVCHDDGHSARLRNTGNGMMEDGSDMMDLMFYPEINGNDNSGNYGTTWCDFDRDGDIDLFIAKCRQFINDPYDPRRTNILMVNDGNNNFSDEAPERGLVNLQQSWTSDFVDMDNDSDFDVLITTHSGTIELYENDGAGYFTNVTAGSGVEYPGFYLQAKMVDFDNDGWQDIVHAGGAEGYFHNNGDFTFTKSSNFPFENSDGLHSFGIGDLNNDGWLDLYASYGDGYVDPDFGNNDQLFLNDGGTNNYIVFDLEGTVSNKDASGAIVEIHGPWGVQIREVRNGESYGISNSTKCHFGLGNSTEVDYAIIFWPAGGVQVIQNPEVNTFHEIIEGECTSIPTAVISANGDTEMCIGGEVTLTIVESATNYVWSNGMETPSLQVTTQGNYRLIVWDENGCGAFSNQIPVTFVTDPTPSITVSGDLEFCQGSNVQLIASEGTSFMWSNGEETQAITVTEAGDYTVEVTGACEELTTTPITVFVYNTPVNPVATDITINSGSTATFTVTDGSNVSWYDSEIATTPIFTGSSFTTPALTESTSYWVEDAITYGGTEGEGGKLAKEETAGVYQQSINYYLLFDVAEDVTLNSVKVYAQGAGNRTIQVIDNNGNEITSGVFNIANGESVVDLNFFIPAGTGYGIRCTSNNPLLWRDKNVDDPAPFDFPYDINGLVTITETNVGGDDADNYYYFFYDWQVSTPSWNCISGRTQVQAIITGVEELPGVNSVSIYPNPASSFTNVAISSMVAGKMNMNLIDQTGRVIQTTQWNLSNGQNNMNLDLSDVASGVYQFNLIMNGKSISRKIVVE